MVSDEEYDLASSIGVEKNHFIYNGIAKSKDTFLEVIRNHVIVNIDSEYEINWIDELTAMDRGQDKSYEVGIRVNFELESYCLGQT